jgi:hypothetical protein
MNRELEVGPIMIRKLGKYATVINVILTAANILILCMTTWYAVRESRLASQGPLIAQLSKNFFFDPTMVKFRRAVDSKTPILSEKTSLTKTDIDTYIGELDMIQGLADKRVLDCDVVEDNFGAYAQDAWENKEINAYVLDQRRFNDLSYANFEKLAKSKGCK